ncbi:Mitochondrial copper homeostasis protein, partial [Dispira parvispora]
MSSRPTHGQFAGKISTMYLNPCEIESQDSLACLERNPNNKKACQKYFDTYKECKREWIVGDSPGFGCDGWYDDGNGHDPVGLVPWKDRVGSPDYDCGCDAISDDRNLHHAGRSADGNRDE